MKWYNSDGDKLEVSFSTDFSYATYVIISSMEAAETLYDFCYDQGYYCPCVDENNRFDRNKLGCFWWDNDQDRWRCLNEEKQEIREKDKMFQEFLKRG
jgi:hypothetical protein